MKPAIALATPGPAPRNVARVMVVDDNQGEFDLLEAGFTACGVEVELITATTGHLAIANLLLTSEKWPSFALVDIGMPVLSGFDVLTHLTVRNIPTIMISGLITPERQVRARAHGAIDLLAKPADTDGYARLAARILALVDPLRCLTVPSPRG